MITSAGLALASQGKRAVVLLTDSLALVGSGRTMAMGSRKVSGTSGLGVSPGALADARASSVGESRDPLDRTILGG